MLKRINSLQGTLLLHELSFVVLILITAVVSIVWSVSWQRSSEESLRLSSMNTVVQNIRGEVYRQSKEVFDASFLHDSDAADEYKTYTNKINAYILELDGLTTDHVEQQAISDVSNAYSAFYRETVHLFDQTNISIEQQHLLDNQLEQHTFAVLEQAFSNFDIVLQVKQQQLSASRKRWSTRLSWLAPVPIIIAVGLFLIARRFVRKNIIQPLSTVIDGAKIISKGEFHHEIALTGAPELIRLSKAINTMAIELESSRNTLVETKKQAALGELVPLVAHNIRNPLAGIRAASQVARDEEASADTRDTLTDIMVAVDRLERWVTSLLSYLHPVKPHLSNTTLTSVVDNALSLIELQLTDKQITIIKDGWLKDAQRLPLDINLLEQAIFNLIQNALEASSTGDVIQLNYRQQADYVSLTISDQGSGMQFDPISEQVIDGETKRLGCGLGIPFALKIIKQHDGNLIYDSNAQQQGTAVTIILKLLPGHDENH